MKKKRMNRMEFINKVNVIVRGNYAHNNEPISFSEVAEYLSTTSDNLRLKKQDTDLMNELKRHGIVVKLIGNMNYFVFEN
ncbi:hypothetical protein [Bacillus multifaciens]|uniref:hypothetical protein n=1 Tax=Bacillus multifaciens TaxID=3068506 RepID=UPI0027418530|nr:hypothetical protein [Bacillus sp. WLY-B-L8]MDP7980477.1 hypothetical protein [Bacillus sp. WLY-B-L8]